MKKIIISLTLATLLLGLAIPQNTISQTNVYHPFPDSNALWREYSGGYQCSCCSDYQYFITGDTIINSFTYHKIKKSGVKYSEDMSGFCTNIIILYYNNYIGAFREDTINKKVFFIPENNSYDTLLYDFNLSIGDTLPTSIINDSINYMNHVSLIDSIIVGNKYYKRYGLSSGSNLNYVYLIQGIGSTFGLFGYLYPPFESGTTLLCFKQNGQTVYPDSTYQCGIVTKKDEVLIENFLFNISPNPISTTARIEINTNIPKIDMIIYNSLGIELLRYKNINNKTKIEKGNLYSGLYFYKLVQDDKIIFKGKL